MNAVDATCASLFCKYESVKMGYWTDVFLCNMIDSVPLL